MTTIARYIPTKNYDSMFAFIIRMVSKFMQMMTGLIMEKIGMK